MADINRLIDKDLEEIDIIDGKLQVEDKNLTNAKDTATNNLGIIETEHKEIHEGNHFFNSYLLSMTGNATYDWVLITGEKYAHVTFTLQTAEAGFSFITYEGITANNDGTIVPNILNNNRNSANASTILFRLAPTGVVTIGSQQVRQGHYGTAAGTGNSVGGSVTRENELILKPNTKYLLRITNLSAQANRMNITHSWYEK